MTTPAGRPGTRWWRSRAFVQPLLVTSVGVVVSTVSYLGAQRLANGSSDGPCTLGPDTCGYMWMGAMGQAVALLPVFLAGLLITGFVVALSSRDRGLALRAVLVGVVLPPVVATAVLVLPNAVADGRDVPLRIASNLGGAVLIGLVFLIPVALGFGVGRAVRPRPGTD